MQINVTGIDPWELLAALCNASRVSPTWACTIQADRTPSNTINAVQAKEETLSDIREGYEFPSYLGGAPLWPDYLFGRPIKAHLKRDGDALWLTRSELYDRDVGEGAAQRVVNTLRRNYVQDF